MFIRANRYEAGRGHIAVYNWDRVSTVAVDLSSVLQVGQAYEIRSAQNYLGGAVVTGVYDGRPISLPMTNLTVAAILGYDFTPAPTGPEFNAFVILPK